MASYSKVAVLIKNSLILWTFFASFSSWRVATVLAGLAHAALHFFRIKPVEKEVVDQLFQELREKLSSSKQPQIFHRAGFDVAPENSLESIRSAGQRDAVGVEIDLAFTQDGVGVLFHDPTVDRLSDAGGEIGKMTLANLRQINIAAKHPRKNDLGFISVPTLEEALAECRKFDLFVVLDCKGAHHPRQTAELLKSLFTRNPDMYQKAVVASFFPHILYMVRKTDPKILTAMLYREYAIEALVAYTSPRLRPLLLPLARVLDIPYNWMQASWIWYLCGANVVLAHVDSLSSGMLKYWHGMNLEVMAWTVNDPLDKQYFTESLQVPVISDTPTTRP